MSNGLRINGSMRASVLVAKVSYALNAAASPENTAAMNRYFGGDGRQPTVEDIEATFGPDAARHYADILQATAEFKKATSVAIDQVRNAEAPDTEERTR